MTAKHRYLTVTLFDEPPCRIWTGDWPIIADSRRAVQGWRYQLIVRQHADGRALVSGIARPAAGVDDDLRERRGAILATNRMRNDDPAHITDAIRAVADRMEFGDDLVRQCIALLPARTI